MTTTAEEKALCVLAVLAGDISAEDAARLYRVSPDEVCEWCFEFVAAGEAGLDETPA